MPDHFGGMPLAPEMNPFQAEVGSNQRLLTGRDLQDGTVIPDTRYNPFSSSRATSDARNEQFFRERQDGSMIYKLGGLGGPNMGRMLTLMTGNHCTLQSIQQKFPVGRRCWQLHGCNAYTASDCSLYCRGLPLVTRRGTVGYACLS